MEPADWDGFRVEAIPPHTFLKRNAIHADLLAAVLRRTRRSVLEVGVGSGAQSALLSHLVSHVVTVDNDARILSVARGNLQRFGIAARAIRADAFRLPFGDAAFDVALSQGLMEHFDDEAIAALLREQLRTCRSVLFSVPSDNYPRQDVGNERLMPPARWLAIAGNALGGAYDVRARYYRFDPESLKYSLLARRPLGSFSVLVTIDRRNGTH